ncbi:MAG: zinc-binding dehydrogenase [Caldilineaceae bacterium]|nr:zinc-binding dehydrogenase [Caldilineaceae bacterium]
MDLTGRAVVVTGQAFSVEQGRVPDPAAGGLLLQQELGGICGTDLHNWQNGLPESTLLGHEAVGTVAALGSGRSRDYLGNPLREGDRVVYHPRNALGKPFGYRGLESPFSGGFAEYIHLDDPDACVIRTATDPRTAVLAEPFAIGTHAVMRAEVQLGDTVLVQGSGAIGLMVMICARLSGAARVIVIGGPSGRLALAKRLGAHETIDIAVHSEQEARHALVMDLTRGEGADVVFECAGFLPAVPEGFGYVKQDGKFIECGHFVDIGEVPINPARHILIPNIRVEGIWGSRFPHFVRGHALLEQSDLPIGEMVSHVLPLERVQAGFDALNGTYSLDGEDVVKIALAREPAMFD